MGGIPAAGRSGPAGWVALGAISVVAGIIGAIADYSDDGRVNGSIIGLNSPAHSESVDEGEDRQGSAGRGGDGRALQRNDNHPPEQKPSGPQITPPESGLFLPDFTVHGADRQEERGVPAVVIGGILMDNKTYSTWSARDTTVFFNERNNITVVISNENGRTVSVRIGRPEQEAWSRIQEKMESAESSSADKEKGDKDCFSEAESGTTK